MSADTDRELTAADVLGGDAPAAGTTGERRAPRASDLLMRQLLACRAMLDATALQLDAAFEVVNRIRDAEDMAAAAASIEQPPDARKPPPTFGAKRRGAGDATVGAAPPSPSPSPTPGS